MSSLAKNTPMMTVASSGADEPAAMNLMRVIKADEEDDKTLGL